MMFNEKTGVPGWKGIEISTTQKNGAIIRSQSSRCIDEMIVNLVYGSYYKPQVILFFIYQLIIPSNCHIVHIDYYRVEREMLDWIRLFMQIS